MQGYEARTCHTQFCNANSMHNTITADSSRWRGMECSSNSVLPGADCSVESEGFRVSEVTQVNSPMRHMGKLRPRVSCPTPGCKQWRKDETLNPTCWLVPTSFTD